MIVSEKNACRIDAKCVLHEDRFPACSCTLHMWVHDSLVRPLQRDVVTVGGRATTTCVELTC